MKAKLTKSYIDKLKPKTGGHYIAWDEDLRGFGVRVNGDGSKTFILYYRTKATRQQRKTQLCRYGEKTVEEARAKAERWRGIIADGGDPAGQEHEERNVETLEELANRYMEEHAEPHKRPSTVTHDRSLLKQIIIPKLGKHKAAAITQDDISRLKLSLKDTPIRANRVLALLSHMYSIAVNEFKLFPQGFNPCRGVKRFKENKIERYLTPDEMARLGKALKDAEKTESVQVVNALRVIMLTGARRGEIQNCRWEWVDWSGAKIDLPEEASKTGKKSILLPAQAVEILKQMKEAAGDSPWLLAGSRGAVADIHRPWYRIRKAAGMPDLRIHDLRHSFASAGVTLGMGLPVIGGLLGHTRAETTARYAHLANDPARSAAAAIGDAISEAMSAKVQIIDLAPKKADGSKFKKAEGGN